MTAAEIVPFGKYKGQPVETLAADRDYCDWLTAQPWFSERYRTPFFPARHLGGRAQHLRGVEHPLGRRKFDIGSVTAKRCR